MKQFIFSLLAVLILAGSGPAESAVILDGAYITAVEDFVYGGATYDVEFKYGTFNAVFGSTIPEFWGDSTPDIHEDIGLALCQAFNDAGHQTKIIRDGSNATSTFYLPIGEGTNSTLYDFEGFRNDTPPWSWSNTYTEVGKGSVLGMFAVFTPVPIPGAVWLLGSGLIGLVGVRRSFRKV